MSHRLLEAAKAVLDHNWTGQFTKPAPHLLPHQWNWDAGFIAIGYAHYDLEKAKSELRSLFRGQWSNGMVPQIVFHPESECQSQDFPGADFWECHRSPHAPSSLRTSGITMPPVHGFALWHIYEKAEDKAAITDFIVELFPKVKALHRYLYKNRDPHDEGLVYVHHPWEPGTDNSPAWDHSLSRIDPQKFRSAPYNLQGVKTAQHRPASKDYDRYMYLVDLFKSHNYQDTAIFQSCPFLIQDPLFNAILIQSNECLLELAGVLNEDVSEISDWYEAGVHAMNEKLWNEQNALYDAYDLRENCRISAETSSGLMPLFAGVPTVEQAELMVKVLKSEKFSGKNGNSVYLCPTYNQQAHDVSYREYWRGPIWVNMNWMLYKGLSRYFFIEEAELVKWDTVDLLTKYGFFEYFDPRKSVQANAGYGTSQYSWSAALCIDLLMEI